MAPLTLSADAKATMRTNLELELKSRRDKLVAMAEAQIASLKSRLERRVNRVPLKQRKMTIVTLIEANKPTPTVEVSQPTRARHPAPAPIENPVPPPVVRKTRAAPAPKPTAPKPAPRPAAKTTRKPSAPKTVPIEPVKPAPKPTRGTKRSSHDMEDKENSNNGDELQVPKKRVKAAAAPPAPATRSTRTRAASKNIAPASQVLSPKTNNARPVAQTRTRRQR